MSSLVAKALPTDASRLVVTTALWGVIPPVQSEQVSDNAVVRPSGRFVKQQCILTVAADQKWVHSKNGLHYDEWTVGPGTNDVGGAQGAAGERQNESQGAVFGCPVGRFDAVCIRASGPAAGGAVLQGSRHDVRARWRTPMGHLALRADGVRRRADANVRHEPVSPDRGAASNPNPWVRECADRVGWLALGQGFTQQRQPIGRYHGVREE